MTRWLPGKEEASWRRRRTNLERGKVDDAVNLGMLGEDIVQRCLVGDIGLVEDWSFATDQLDTVDGDL